MQNISAVPPAFCAHGLYSSSPLHSEDSRLSCRRSEPAADFSAAPFASVSG